VRRVPGSKPTERLVRHIARTAGAAAICLALPNAWALILAEEGTARADIVVAADAIESERHAATELAAFLRRMAGAEFRITSGKARGAGRILVGEGAARRADPTFSVSDLGEEGVVVRTLGDDLILAGGRPRGTLYAVYTFLEETLGCRWWTPTESTIPRSSSIAVDALDVSFVPPFEYREALYPEAADADFSVRNKLNGHSHRLFVDNGLRNAREDAKRGGRKFAFHKTDKWSWGTFWTLIPPEIYLPEHPEWFAEVPADQSYMDGVHYGSGADGIPTMIGKGIRPQSRAELNDAPFWPYSSLCLSNEGMRREFVRNSKLAIVQSPIASWFSVTQLDGVNCCRCDGCMAIAREEGAYSGAMIRFVNAVAEELETFTGMPFVTEAYHYTRKPPRLSKPRDSVIVVMLTAYDFIDGDRFLAYSMPFTDERNAGFRDDLAGWAKICKRLYVWYYMDNHAPPLIPFPNLRNWGPDLKFFASRGVKGVYGEGHAKELVELRAWLWSKLLWNPNADARNLAEIFCRGYYGAAGQHVLAYLDCIHDAVEKSGYRLPIGHGHEYLSFQTLAESWAHLAMAESAVRDDPQLLARVHSVQLPVTYSFLMSWERYQEEAGVSGIAWPLSRDKNAVLRGFVAAAERNGIGVIGPQSKREQVENPRLSDVVISIPMR